MAVYGNIEKLIYYHQYVGGIYTILKERERAFPLRIAVLIADGEWTSMDTAE